MPLPTALVPARPCLAGTASHAPQHHGTMNVARPSSGRRPVRPAGTTPVRIPATPNAIPATAAAALPPIRTGKRLPRPTPTLDALSAKEPLSWPLHRPPSCWKTCLASNSRAEARAPLKRRGSASIYHFCHAIRWRAECITPAGLRRGNSSICPPPQPGPHRPQPPHSAARGGRWRSRAARCRARWFHRPPSRSGPRPA